MAKKKEPLHGKDYRSPSVWTVKTMTWKEEQQHREGLAKASMEGYLAETATVTLIPMLAMAVTQANGTIDELTKEIAIMQKRVDE